MRAEAAARSTAGVGPFHVHRFHDFEGFCIEQHGGRELLVARCACGEILDVARAVYTACPDCTGSCSSCSRCGGTGQVVDHAALRWQLREEREERDADAP